MHADNEFKSTCCGADVLISSETAHDSVGNVNGGKIDYMSIKLLNDKLLRGDSRLFHKLVDDAETDRFGRNIDSLKTTPVL